ncbi:MAG: SDR family NAD(P)-dependent oxidoreductase [Rhodospirillales bacterium]|nr:SDR family NAD(P)-dependent oxidoreductase [Rhodospirillales bacterium]
MGDIDEARLAKLAAGWPGGGSLPPARFATFDIRDAAATGAFVRQAVDKFGAVDGALNAAGVLDLAPALELSESAFRRSLDVNVTGSLPFSRAAVKAMRREGRIVHLASVSSFAANAKHAAYASAKAALAHRARAEILVVERAAVEIERGGETLDPKARDRLARPRPPSRPGKSKSARPWPEPSIAGRRRAARPSSRSGKRSRAARHCARSK